MPNRNVHEVMGHLGKDPELRVTPTGKSVCRLSVATSNRTFDKKTQKWVSKDPDWHNVVVWGELAEKVAQEFKKGDAIMVRGKSKTRTYKDKDDQKKSITEIEAKEVLKPVYVSMTIKAKDEGSDAFEAFETEMEEEADIPYYKDESVPNSNGFGNPTNKQLAYVKKLAEQAGVELNEDDLSTFHKVSVLIDELQKKIKPTDKQVSVAKKLAEKMNAEIPQKALESKAAMSRWLEKVLKHEQMDRKGDEADEEADIPF